MRLWHDDVRPAPHGWLWAKTNEEAMQILRTGEVVTASLDHDMGAAPEDGIFARGVSLHGSGLDLARQMILENLVPETVVIHSWSPVGARNMVNAFKDAGYDAIVAPFDPRNYA
jgi:hypothetical protein